MGPSDKSANILVVEDEEIVRRTCSRLLTTLGHKVAAAASAEAAQALVARQRFDLVLTDIRLPGVQGDALIATLRKEQPDLVAVIMTGYPSVELAIGAVEQRVYRFLTKPFQLNELRQAVVDALAERDREERRAHDRFAHALLAMEARLGDDFDLQAAVEELLGRQDSTPSGATAPPPAATAPSQAAAAKAAATPTPPGVETKHYYVVVCEPIPQNRHHLREADAYRHFRCVYAAHRVINERLCEDHVPARVELVLAGHTSELPRHFRRHAEDIICVVFGPNLARLTRATVSMMANASRHRHVVVCHNPDQTNFSWDELEILSESLDIFGCRLDIPAADVRHFWIRYFQGDLMPLIRRRLEGADDEDRGDLGERLDRDPAAVEALPGFPAICRRVLKAIDAGERFPAVARIVEPDGALQASLLRAANSAHYGARQRIESLATALAMIGAEELRRLILGRTMRELTHSLGQAGFPCHDFFLHSCAVGYLAQLLSLDLESPSPRQQEIIDSLHLPEDVSFALARLQLWRRLQATPGFDPFTAGILHDLGKVLTAACYPDTIALIHAEIHRTEWTDLLACERTVATDFVHPDAGAALLERWEVFPQLVEPVRRHHAPEGHREAGIIGIANMMAAWMYPCPQRVTREGDTSANPIPAAYEALSAPLREQRDDIVAKADDLSAETCEVVYEAARSCATQSPEAAGALWQTVERQMPQVADLWDGLEVHRDDLLTLHLVLESYVEDLVGRLLQSTHT